MTPEQLNLIKELIQVMIRLHDENKEKYPDTAYLSSLEWDQKGIEEKLLGMVNNNLLK